LDKEKTIAHFAHIDENNIVRNVIVVDNDYAPDEITGQAHLASCGFEGTWKQTSYNGKFRGRFAGVGMTYDPVKDEFVAPETTPTV